MLIAVPIVVFGLTTSMENVRHGVAAVTTPSGLQHRDDPTEAAVDHRLISFPWGTDRTVLIEVSVGALQEERELLQRIRALITATEQDRIFRLGDLAPEQRDDLWSLVSRFSPRGRFRSTARSPKPGVFDLTKKGIDVVAFKAGEDRDHGLGLGIDDEEGS